MYSGKKTVILNIVCVVLSVLVAGAVAFLAYRRQQQEAAYSAAVLALQEEARTYELELNSLQSELETLQDDVAYTSEEGKLMVGFLASDLSDFSYMEELAFTYGFSPVLVIDCTLPENEVDSYIAAVDESWEIMLYATAFSEETNEDVLSVIGRLASADREHTGIFLLRQDYCTDANISLLKEDGFSGYTVYHDNTLSIGQTSDGQVYFEYSFLAMTGTVIESRLNALYNSNSAMIIVLDMASVNDGTLPGDYVLELLGIMQTYASYDDCSFSTVADVAAELSGINEIEAANQAEYEQQAAQLQEQIDELKEIIAGIYDRLEN